VVRAARAVAAVHAGGGHEHVPVQQTQDRPPLLFRLRGGALCGRRAGGAPHGSGERPLPARGRTGQSEHPASGRTQLLAQTDSATGAPSRTIQHTRGQPVRRVCAATT